MKLSEPYDSLVSLSLGCHVIIVHKPASHRKVAMAGYHHPELPRQTKKSGAWSIWYTICDADGRDDFSNRFFDSVNMATVIIGAGIIGTSTAYYLSQAPSVTPPTSIHLVESSPRLFASASGYAAGFLARDWFSPSVSALGALSFDLHKQLAEEHSGAEKWGWSRSTGTSLVQGTPTADGARGDDWLREGSSRAAVAGAHEFISGEGPAWLTRQEGSSIEVISEGDSTAQVYIPLSPLHLNLQLTTRPCVSDPLRLSQFLLSACRSRGVHLHHPCTAISIATDPLHHTLSSIRLLDARSHTQTDLPCTRLVLAAGAWTPHVFRTLFPSSPLRIPITPLAGHSLVVRSPRWAPGGAAGGCHAVFTTDDAGFAPEIFSRAGGEIYVAGLNSADVALPALATEARVDDDAVARLREVARKLLGVPGGREDELQVVREGLCFRPVTRSGRPVVMRVEEGALGDGVGTRGAGEGGVFVGAGHGPWGISLSLGTGKVLAEMVEGKSGWELSASVSVLGL